MEGDKPPQDVPYLCVCPLPGLLTESPWSPTIDIVGDDGSCRGSSSGVVMCYVKTAYLGN